MLTSHPQICIPPECGFIQWWHSKYNDWKYQDSISHDRREGFVNDLKTSRKIETWELDYALVSEVISEYGPKNYAELCLCVIASYARQHHRKVTYLGDKNNYYLDHLDLLKALFKEAKFLGIVRDGRDVACSYREVSQLKTKSPYKPILTENISEIAKEWFFNNQRMLNFLLERNNDHCYIIKYENLVTKSEDTLRNICYFLTLPYESVMLDYYKNDQAFLKEPIKTIDWKVKILEKPDGCNIGRYQAELTDNEILTFNSIAGGMLKHFDYKM